ncbi:TetR/AcrR family transcriptional regulator [Rhizomonospora bruguierae]|uniref:TetR/AcrR family transcriptional regulator n=1 Tax=Rhizomonospora bruguierae TaxID=1581705 RepID=UPI001BD173AB|nr:TetR/AcrR family transcriptional regulator [Micromonospora sp. NBRC 107566]
MAAAAGPAPSFKRLPRAVRERQMLDAAVRVFARRGFHAASMDEIAEDAGISKPMVYAYLGTKDELFLACLHREGTRIMEALVAVVRPDLPPDEQMWRGLRAFFRYVGQNRDGWVVLFRQARGRSRAAGALAEMRARIIEIVTGMLGRAVPVDGRPVRPNDLTAVAYALVGAAESMADRLASDPAADPDRTAARMMNIAWLGAAQLLAGSVWRPDQP